MSSKIFSMDIFGISLSRLKYDSFFSNLMKSDTPQIVFTPNPEMLLVARQDNNFTQILKKADYLLPDGVGLYIAFCILDSKTPFILSILLLPYYIFQVLFCKKYLYEKYGSRICGSDITKDILHYAQKNSLEIAVIDLYNPTDIKKTQSQQVFLSKMKEFFPTLKVHHFIWKQEEKEAIKSQIAQLKIPYVFSTLWMKKQEESIIEILEESKTIKIWIWVWSSFDYFTWLQVRAPKYIRNLGFEWLYRLLFWPQKIKRLKRLWNAVVVFIYYVYMYRKRAHLK